MRDLPAWGKVAVRECAGKSPAPRAKEKESALIHSEWVKDFRDVWPEGWDDDIRS